MKAKLFEEWFKKYLLAVLLIGSVIVMDNASFHRKRILKELAIEKGCRIIFLPPYSPDLNPIEKKWANLKHWLRSHIHEYKSLSEAINFYFQAG